MQLINDLKNLIQELKEEEKESLRLGHSQKYSALCFARVNLEAVLERNGYVRPASLEMAHGETPDIRVN